MRGAEQGFLLLTSPLGDPDCKVLTVAQFRELTKRVRQMERPREDRELNIRDLTELGYDHAFAEHILQLLFRKEQLEYYLHQARKNDCGVLTRLSDLYPEQLYQKLGAECPGCLWYKGDAALLVKPCVALVGSRQLRQDNSRFAREVGRQAALQGYVLVSGNANGADRTAQESCLEHGGQVISIVADSLTKQSAKEGILYISEHGFDASFSPQRAHSRNRLIHALPHKTFVAQCTFNAGGTWKGTTQNLRHHWSDVFCYNDGSEAMRHLCQMGAESISFLDLADISALSENHTLFD